MRVRRTFAVLALVVGAAALAWSVTPAFADVRDISVGGVYITTIKHDAKGYTAEQRATEITRRITQILSAPEMREGAVVSVKQSGADALVSVGSFLVFTVTPADAEGSGTTLYVAKQWAALLAQGLTKALPGSNFHGF